MAARNAIKLELPVEVEAFKFTFECRSPGPITIEISIGKPPQQLSLQAGIVEGPDTSGAHTEMPGVLDDWLKAQKTQYQSFLLDVVKGGPLVVDESVTEPESEPTAEDIKCAAQVLVSSTEQLVDIIDESMTEPESEPATPVEFYRWYHVSPIRAFATHVGACCRNFGPLHDFWTFLFERLNKVLKSFKTNNHANGELETTFFREFQRTCEIGRLTYGLQTYPEDSLPPQAAMHMLKATNEERGTVAGLTALTRDLDDASADDVYFKLLSPDKINVVRHISTTGPHYLHSVSSYTYHMAVFFDYVVIRGKCYNASRTTGSNNSSFVHVLIPQTDATPIHAYGEVLEIFQYMQNFCGVGSPMWFVQMRWFVPWTGECKDIWRTFTSVNVRLWRLGEYRNNDTQLPHLIDPDWIISQLGMTVVSIGHKRTKAWATIDLAKVNFYC
ncbi:hypothetical protein P692DRAFT_20881200 [Suillus brevipes Sb2]|nr:hypothetical protein P692DRAFT_20881200 [Suillus brevipes Sb2]